MSEKSAFIRRVIGITGKKGHGKDTLCNALQQIAGDKVDRVAFGDALKREVAELLGITVDDINADKPRFRLMLQFYGTEWRRHQDPEYWIKRLRETIAGLPAFCIAVVTDVRFANEAALIEELGGFTVRVTAWKRYPDDSDNHSSETELDNNLYREVTNDGSPEDLLEQARFLLIP